MNPIEHEMQVSDVLQSRTMRRIAEEVVRARGLHPDWPGDVIHGAAIIAEEAGETVKAALDYRYHHGESDEAYDHIMTETIQTAATCVRMLEE